MAKDTDGSLSPVDFRHPESKITVSRVFVSSACMLLSLAVFQIPLFRATGGRIPCAWTWQPDEAVTKQEQASANKRRLGDGCYHVYLDAGANIGVHTRFLFEPDLYPEAGAARTIFDGEFGKGRDNRDFCSFGFEPNPIHVTHHRQMEVAYDALGWRYQFFHAGVSDHDGNLTFYRIDNEHESMHNEWGFSMVKRHDQAIPVQVPVFDFAHWIKENIANRELPKIVHGNYTKPKVVMKVDIEGSEYVMLPRLLFSGIMCEIVDLTFGELHAVDAYRMQRNATNPEEHRGEIKFLNQQEVDDWPKWLIDRGFDSQAMNGCPGRWRYLDDEAYVSDTTPLPKVSTGSSV